MAKTMDALFQFLYNCDDLISGDLAAFVTGL
jgi:hypothetical protein